MTSPNPRSKILPARGNLSDLQFAVDDILEGEMMYAYDQDQYYQKENGTFVAVGATKAQGALADSALQDSPSDGTQYVRKDGSWVVLDAGSGGVTAASENAIPYYGADGDIITGSDTSQLNWDPLTGTLFVVNLTANDWNITGQLSVESLDINGAGPATIDSDSDIVFSAVGNIDTSSSRITNVADPVDSTDATNKQWVEQAIATATTTDPVVTYVFSAVGSTGWNIQGQGYEPGNTKFNQNLYVYRGMTYRFTNDSDDTSAFPLLIKSIPNNTGTSNQFTEGVIESDPAGDYLWTIPMNPSITTVYYQAQGNSNMCGAITIVPENYSDPNEV